MSPPMTDSTLVFVDDLPDGAQIVVNFGIHAGREVTQAEIDRLAPPLLDRIPSFAVVSQRRFGFDRQAEAAVHQVLVELPRGQASQPVLDLVEDWARDCIRERSLLT